MIAFERRASTVLFNLLLSHPMEGPFLLPSNICPIVPITFRKARRSFEFIDVAADTLCMDTDAVLERWLKPSNRPAGLVYVRTFGAVFDSSEVFETIKTISPDALIIDDRCLCPPDFTDSIPPFADVVIYSTGYGKYVDVGYGGYGVLKFGVPYMRKESVYISSDLAEVTERYKSSLSKRTAFQYQDCGWLDTSPPSEEWTAYRERVEIELSRISNVKAITNSIYTTGLPLDIQLPSIFQSWRFNIQVLDKEAVLKVIRRAGLFASGHYDSLAGIFGAGSGHFAETTHRHVINLFNDRYFNTKQAIELTSILASSELVSPGPLFR